MRALVGVVIVMCALSAAQAADCGDNGFCPFPTATRGDIIYYPERDQRTSEGYDYGDVARMEECVIADRRRGLRVSPETCIRIGGLVSFQFQHESLDMIGLPFGRSRTGYDGEVQLRIEAGTQTEFGELISVFRHFERNAYFTTPQNEIYMRLGGLVIGQTSSFWDSNGPSDYANFSTFTWNGERAGADNIRDVLGYISKKGPVGFGVSVEAVSDNNRLSRPGLVAVATFDGDWGGTWIKAAYDTAFHKLSMKAGIHWDIVPGKAAARLIGSWTEGRSYYTPHYFESFNSSERWGIMGAYQHYLTDSVSASASVGAFGGTDRTALATELSMVWRPSETGELRVEGTYYRDPNFDMTGVTASVRFTRFF